MDFSVLGSVVILTKLLIVTSLVGLFRCSVKFRSMSRRRDEDAFAALKRIVHATEESGYHPHLIPLFMLLTALCFMLSVYLTAAAVQ